MNAGEGGLTLAEILGRTPRRYRLPELPGLESTLQDSRRRANWLAIVIETARRSLAASKTPDTQLKQAFLDTLQALIQDAMHSENGDTTFQAMVLRQSSAIVAEYVGLATQQAQDSRRVHSLVNAIAHPAKLERLPAGALRDGLAQLQKAVAAEQWAEADDLLPPLLATVGGTGDSTVGEGLRKLAEDPSLQRLQKLQALLQHEDVTEYRRLWGQQGPRANTHAAAQEGAEARRRGMDVETLTRHALQSVADALNGGALETYQVATSMYVPATLAAGHVGSKTEWDAVLLKQAPSDASGDAIWDIELLVEAKASADAIATDFPRLLRGLQLLAAADAHQTYSFKAREGSFVIRGATLSTLPTAPEALVGMVLYCSDTPADDYPRLLSAAARMQLLSAPESLKFATALAQGEPARQSLLEPLWEQLLYAPQWEALLHQYLALAQARELMVHTDDLAAVGNSTHP